MPPSTLELQFAAEEVLHHLDRFALVQRITGLRVIPGPGFVTFRFRTNHATVPIVQVYQYVPDTDHAGEENLVASQFPLFAGPQLAHELRIDGLQQNERFTFRITAASSDPEALPAVSPGSFVTPTRTVEIFFDDIHVTCDGDPGGKGEMRFQAAVYDTITEQMVAGQFITPRTDIGDGAYVDVPFGDPAGGIGRAPKFLTVFITGDDRDADVIPYPGQGLGVSGSALPHDRIPPADHGETDDAVWANAAQQIELPDSGIFVFPLRLDSGNWGVAYIARVRIQGNVSTMVELSASGGGGPTSSTLVDVDGKIAAVGAAGRKPVLLARAPDGTLHRGTSRKDGDWRSLGGEATGPVTAVTAKDGRVHLFAVTRDGTVSHGAVNGAGSCRWRDLGGSAKGPVAALASGGEIHLCVLDAAGEPHHRRLRGRAWEPLGGSFDGPLVLADGDGPGFTLFALDRDRTVSAMTYDGRSWSRDWQRLGSVDALDPVLELEDESCG